MKVLFTQLALLLGGIVAALSMALNLSQGLDLLLHICHLVVTWEH